MIPRFKTNFNFKEICKILLINKNAVYLFEKKFAKKFGAKEAIAFPYGRSAQWCFLKALNISDSEIIMPAYTCSVVAHAISLSGNTPIFVDITLDDYNMDLESLPSKITSNTRAIIATHTFGYPQNTDKIKNIILNAEKRFGNKIWFINDCCHAFGAKHNGDLVGNTGDVAIYALNISKIITSIFGGMLTFQDEQLANKVRQWRDENYAPPAFSKSLKRRLYLIATFFAFSKSLYWLTHLIQNKTKILKRYTDSFHLDNKIHFPPDYLEQMADIEAAVGMVQLEKYDEIIDWRRRKAADYHKKFADRKGWELPPINEDATYSHFSIRVEDRDAVIQEFCSKGEEWGQLIQYSIPHLSCYEGSQCFEYPNSLLASKVTVNAPL
jgi:perosamine synthetase